MNDIISHDSLFKRCYHRAENFRAFLSMNLPKSVLQRLDLSRLERCPTEHMHVKLRRKQVDVLWQCPLTGSEMQPVLFHVEHQSSWDRSIKRRLLDYDHALHGYYLETFDDVPLIISWVVYTGPPKSGPETLSLLSGPSAEAVYAFTHSRQSLLVRPSEQEVMAWKNPSLLCTHLVLSSFQRKADVFHWIESEVFFKALATISRSGDFELLADLLYYVSVALSKRSKQHFLEWLERAEQTLGESMMHFGTKSEILESFQATLDSLSREDWQEFFERRGERRGEQRGEQRGEHRGKKLGLEQGVIETKTDYIMKLYKHGLSGERISELLELPLNDVQSIIGSSDQRP